MSRLASFRVDEDNWERFQQLARQNGTTATTLLNRFINNVVSSGNVNDVPLTKQDVEELVTTLINQKLHQLKIRPNSINQPLQEDIPKNTPSIIAYKPRKPQG